MPQDSDVRNKGIKKEETVAHRGQASREPAEAGGELVLPSECSMNGPAKNRTPVSKVVVRSLGAECRRRHMPRELKEQRSFVAMAAKYLDLDGRILCYLRADKLSNTIVLMSG